MTVYFIREAQPDEHHDAAAIRLPPVTCLSHRIMGTFHRNWCEILSRVCNVSRWWLIPDIFLCQCYRVCGIMVERTRNFFVKLDCKELDFSHSTGSFNKNSLSGHQAECWRYRPTWLNNYMIWWYSSGLRELKLEYFIPASPYSAEGMCSRGCWDKMLEIPLAWPKSPLPLVSI